MSENDNEPRTMIPADLLLRRAQLLDQDVASMEGLSALLAASNCLELVTVLHDSGAGVVPEDVLNRCVERLVLMDQEYRQGLVDSDSVIDSLGEISSKLDKLLGDEEPGAFGSVRLSVTTTDGVAIYRGRARFAEKVDPPGEPITLVLRDVQWEARPDPSFINDNSSCVHVQGAGLSHVFSCVRVLTVSEGSWLFVATSVEVKADV